MIAAVGQTNSDATTPEQDAFMILVSGGTLCEGMVPLLLSRARRAWVSRSDKHVAHLDLGDLSVPPNLVAEVRPLPRLHEPVEPPKFAILVAGDWSQSGKRAVAQLLTEIGHAIANDKPFVLEPLQKFDEHTCRLAQVTNSDGSRWVGWALIGDATDDEAAGLCRVSVAAIVLEEDARDFASQPNPDNVLCIPTVVLRPTELPFGTNLPDPIDPAKETCVVAHQGKNFVLILHGEEAFEAQHGDLVFRNVTMKGLNGNSLLGVYEDEDGPSGGSAS